MRKNYILLIVALMFECTYINASPPLEIAVKLKEKIRKGKTLVEELNALLDRVKINLEKGIPVDKNVLNELVDIKDKFKNLEVDPGDLPVDLIENFKKKTLDAFSLILASYKLDKIPEVKKTEKLKSQVAENIKKKVKSEFSKLLPGEL